MNDAGAIAFALLNEIAIIDQLASTAAARALRPGLTLAQFGVLNHFARRGGAESPSRLAKAFQVTKGAMTGVLGELERQGLIAVREDKSDGRAKRVSITRKGLSAHGKAVASLLPRLEPIGAHFGAERIAGALPFLRELRALLDEARNAEDFPDAAREP